MKCVLICAIAMWLALPMFSQTKQSSLLDNVSQLRRASESSTLGDISKQDEFPVGNTIDEKVYLIGPNDVLSIQILPIENVPQTFIVTSQCSVVHPRLGEVSLRNLTLYEVKELFNEKINSKTSGTISVSLVRSRRVYVSIRGNVISPGTYTLPASYNVSTAIKFANQMQSTTAGISAEEQSAITRLQESRKEREKIFSETGMSETSDYSNRNIRLIRGDGSARIVDLERAVATQDATYNPNISEGDEIFVPFDENDYPIISITGQVLRPIATAYKKDDMVSNLLKMGYGFTEKADLNNVYLYSNGEQKKIMVDSNATLLSSDFPLNPGDAIIVGKIEQNKHNETKFGIVSVTGEVKEPSVYIIEKGVTTLKDIIQMAGGFTELAYLPLATVGRRDNTQNERITTKRKYNEYFDHSNLTQQNTMRFTIMIDMKSPRVSCDFVSVFADTTNAINLIVQDGDVISIPRKPNKVNVFGQVNNPGYVDFTEGQTMEWYIDRAGGYATSADKKRARIIRGSNRVWVDGFNDNVYVFDGDEIFVSPPRDVPPEMELQKWAAYSGIAGVVISVFTFIWTVYQTSKK